MKLLIDYHAIQKDLYGVKADLALKRPLILVKDLVANGVSHTQFCIEQWQSTLMLL